LSVYHYVRRLYTLNEIAKAFIDPSEPLDLPLLNYKYLCRICSTSFCCALPPVADGFMHVYYSKSSVIMTCCIINLLILFQFDSIPDWNSQNGLSVSLHVVLSHWAKPVRRDNGIMKICSGVFSWHVVCCNFYVCFVFVPLAKLRVSMLHCFTFFLFACEVLRWYRALLPCVT